MNMSLCKVHLGMFQCCLHGPQLVPSGLRAPGAPAWACPGPWCPAPRNRYYRSAGVGVLPPPTLSRALKNACQDQPVCANENELRAFLPALSFQCRCRTPQVCAGAGHPDLRPMRLRRVPQGKHEVRTSALITGTSSVAETPSVQMTLAALKEQGSGRRPCSCAGRSVRPLGVLLSAEPLILALAPVSSFGELFLCTIWRA